VRSAGNRALARCAGSLALPLAGLWLAGSVARADISTLVGQPAPSLVARALDSEVPIALDGHRGRVVLLAFVATWCGACRAMAPELEAIRRAHPEVEVIALSHEPRDRLRSHAAREPRSYTLAQCTGATARRYQAMALPTLVLVDRAGVVHAAYQGASRAVVEQLRRDVGSLASAH
jgi:thiol-disulfide isomerase/thioredoxin